MKTSAQIENIIKIIKRNYKSTQMERAALCGTMLLSLCIVPHHAQAVDMENYIVMKTRMDLFLTYSGLTEKQFKEVHFTRNNNQKSDVNYSDISASDSGFRKLPPEKSIFHQIGRGNENNEKWTNDKGEEYVFNPSTNPPQLVTNSVNIGTYNFSPESDPTGHYLLDVLPYLLWGNSESDSTTFEERSRLFEKATDETTWAEAVDLAGLTLSNSAQYAGRKAVQKIKIVSNAAREIGQTISNAARETGQTISNVARETGQTIKMVSNAAGHAGRKTGQTIKNLPQVVARVINIQADMISLDYKTLDDFRLGLDLISDNSQENIDARKFRFSTDPVNQQQKEEKNAQSFNDDQRIKTVNLAVKQRQEEQRRIKQTIIKKLPTTPEPGAPAGPNPDPSLKWAGSASVVSSSQDSDSIKGWDRQYWGDGTAVGVLIHHTTLLSDNALPKGGSSTQINFDRGHFTFRSIYSNLYMPQSTTATPNYGDYDYVAWGTWDDSSFIHYYENDNFGGHWVYGQIPKPENMPKLGSASYAGQVRGGYVNYKNGIMEANSITGDINMTVNFQDRNLSGTMNLDRNSSSWATATFSTPITGITSAGPPYDEVPIYFGTRLNVYSEGGGYGGGSMFGWFFGKDAAEVGGSFLVDKFRRDCGCGAAGVFRAKKQ